MSIYLGNNLIDSIGTQNKTIESTTIEDQLIHGAIDIYINNDLTSIGTHAFHGCQNLTQISCYNCTSIGSYAFCNCSQLVQISFPNCTYIGSSAFYSCHQLVQAVFPNCNTIEAYAFSYCSSLTQISFPKVETIEEYAFNYCQALVEVSLPKCTVINSYAFRYCYNLISLNLSGISSVPTLSKNVFNSTPIGGYSTSAGQYGSIYVPASLYSSFLTATNWSNYASRIVSI